MRFTAWTAFSLLLLLAAIGFYLWMGLSFGRWTDLGAYAVAIVLGAFGLVGLFVASAEKRESLA